MNKILFQLGCFFAFIVAGYTASAQQPHVLLMNAGQLASVKKKIQEKDASTLQQVSAL
jgi:hypothetical protein